jgi:hypothetical protein
MRHAQKVHVGSGSSSTFPAPARDVRFTSHCFRGRPILRRREGPTGDITLHLFDHLVSDAEQPRREGEAERLCGLEVDDQLVLGWLLNRQIGWLGALEDAVDVPCRLAELFDVVRTIGDQAA